MGDIMSVVNEVCVLVDKAGSVGAVSGALEMFSSAEGAFS